jgi:membrane glycosyltransferase
MFMEGFTFGHRLLFLNGNLFYFSSFLWFLLLALMTVHAVTNFFHTAVYFSAERTLFPHWPVQYRELSMQLLAGTVAFLFIPKVLSVLLIILSPGRSARFGGALRLFLSVVLETIFSTLLAPLRMIFHAWYVTLNLIGQKLVWKSQFRRSRKTSFLEALWAYWPGTVGALVWGALAYAVNKTLFWWVSVIVVPLLLAVPISMFCSYPSLGLFFRESGLFLTPGEIAPSKVLRCFQELFFKNIK